jgi:tetratricopeptide (TPR) repeat protein
MARIKADDQIDRLIQSEQWDEARALIERERAKEPDSHWLITQLGVTFYEQREYEEALELFKQSRQIKDDCPLTLWNFAGTLDALGRSAEAVKILTWLLESHETPDTDPCWESADWAAALKADCVYRLGLCLEHLGRRRKAEACYRQYIDLLLAGAGGMYPVEDALARVRSLHVGQRNGSQHELRKVVSAALQTVRPQKRRRAASKAP